MSGRLGASATVTGGQPSRQEAVTAQLQRTYQPYCESSERVTLKERAVGAEKRR
mgnify:CR=1 FL=1